MDVLAEMARASIALSPQLAIAVTGCIQTASGLHPNTNVARPRFSWNPFGSGRTKKNRQVDRSVPALSILTKTAHFWGDQPFFTTSEPEQPALPPTKKQIHFSGCLVLVVLAQGVRILRPAPHVWTFQRNMSTAAKKKKLVKDCGARPGYAFSFFVFFSSFFSE